MTYDAAFFDQPTDRAASDSFKWRAFPPDAIPLWIADMDFAAPEEVTRAITDRARHAIFGYAQISQSAIQAMIDWHRALYGWEIDPAWVVPLPGIVTGLNIAGRMLRERTDGRTGMLTGVPIYPPFIAVAGEQGIPGRFFRQELDSLPDDSVIGAESGALFFCNPHNPLSHAWSPDQIRAWAAFATRHNLWFISDEIHGGLVLDPPCTYTPALCAAPDLTDRAIIFVAPSKTFNVAGLGCAFAIIPNPELRARACAAAAGIVPVTNLFGWVGAEAAYRHGEPWRKGMLAYLCGNRTLLETRAAAWQLPMHPLRATFLAWLDCRSLLPRLGGLTPAAFFLRHGVAAQDGTPFGAPGFLRINIATRRALLEEAFSRMDTALNGLPLK